VNDKISDICLFIRNQKKHIRLLLPDLDVTAEKPGDRLPVLVKSQDNRIEVVSVTVTGENIDNSNRRIPDGVYDAGNVLLPFFRPGRITIEVEKQQFIAAADHETAVMQISDHQFMRCLHVAPLLLHSKWHSLVSS
jgi:hypothetical protein